MHLAVRLSEYVDLLEYAASEILFIWFDFLVAT